MIKINKADGILAMSNQWPNVTSCVFGEFWWYSTRYTHGLYDLGNDVRMISNFIRSGVNNDQHNLS